MALSKRAQDALKRAVTDKSAAEELRSTIDAGGNPQAAAVAAIPASTDLSLAAPAAVDLNAVFDDTEVEAALNDKADQAAVSGMMAIAESRLDALEAKVNAILTALKNAGLMAS